MSDPWSYEENMARGYLPTGEPLECLYGTGPWTRQQEREQEPDVCPCPICGEQSYDMGRWIDCLKHGSVNADGTTYVHKETKHYNADEDNQLPF